LPANEIGPEAGESEYPPLELRPTNRALAASPGGSSGHSRVSGSKPAQRFCHLTAVPSRTGRESLRSAFARLCAHAGPLLARGRRVGRRSLARTMSGSRGSSGSIPSPSGEVPSRAARCLLLICTCRMAHPCRVCVALWEPTVVPLGCASPPGIPGVTSLVRLTGGYPPRRHPRGAVARLTAELAPMDALKATQMIDANRCRPAYGETGTSATPVRALRRGVMRREALCGN
jgi:hypothetical protein